MSQQDDGAVNAVTQFGADPTGTTDSTAAIQAAVDFAASKNWRETFYVVTMRSDGPEGRFVVGAPGQTADEFAASYFDDPWVISVSVLHHVNKPVGWRKGAF